MPSAIQRKLFVIKKTKKRVIPIPKKVPTMFDAIFSSSDNAMLENFAKISLNFVSVHNGYPTLTFELGDGPTTAVAPVRVNDEKFHKIEVVLTDREGSIRVDDGKTSSATSRVGFENV